MADGSTSSPQAGSTSSPQGDLEDAIREHAEGPESAEVDGVRAKQHSLADQIEADNYLAGKTAARAGGILAASVLDAKGQS